MQILGSLQDLHPLTTHSGTAEDTLELEEDPEELLLELELLPLEEPLELELDDDGLSLLELD